MKGCRFDPILHKYYIDDIEVPGITGLLPKQDFYVSAERLEETRVEGTENNVIGKLKNKLPSLPFNDRKFYVNQGKKNYNFDRAMEIANRTWKRYGYAIIYYRAHEGHEMGIAEIGVSGKWLY